MKREVNQKVLTALNDALEIIEKYQDLDNPGAMKQIYELVGKAFDIGRGKNDIYYGGSELEWSREDVQRVAYQMGYVFSDDDQRKILNKTFELNAEDLGEAIHEMIGSTIDLLVSSEQVIGVHFNWAKDQKS